MSILLAKDKFSIMAKLMFETNKIKTGITNIPEFSKIGQETPVLKKPISIPNKLHVISIQASIQNFPISLHPRKSQLAQP